MAKLGVGTEGGHERLLEAVLCRVWTDAADEEPMELDAVLVDEELERRQAHCP
jgi:hypothetical protein